MIENYYVKRKKKTWKKPNRENEIETEKWEMKKNRSNWMVLCICVNDFAYNKQVLVVYLVCFSCQK